MLIDASRHTSYAPAARPSRSTAAETGGPERPDTFSGWVNYNLTYAPGEMAFKFVANGIVGTALAGAAGVVASTCLPAEMRLAATVAVAAAGGIGAAVGILGQPDEYGSGGGG